VSLSVTLAAAGEGQLPETTTEYLFRLLRRFKRQEDFNLFINWLKHSSGPDKATISEFEAILVCAGTHKTVKEHIRVSRFFWDAVGS
jgi:hypothetical protein